ncbi:unnamed protein product [Gongylonema pulchrum]|uniref:Uncharacterized protein n=1 Tax=Gongylonema pulchrum TaxID=637853 RepID=A0A3P6S7C0_9BILA|nr:unnamed protein product [Gongylonema pulchrum]
MTHSKKSPVFAQHHFNNTYNCTAVMNKKFLNQTEAMRTAFDKIEDARIKAARERAWRHIDMISASRDNSAINPQRYNFFLFLSTNVFWGNISTFCFVMKR